MKYTFFIIALTVVSCSVDKGSKLSPAEDSTNVTSQSPMATILPNNDTIRNEKDEEGESDCIFNDDYKGLTTEWLTALGKTDFIWREDLDQAFMAMGQDTIVASKGGCEHFGMLVELRLGNDDHNIADSAFWIGKALSLAIEFKFDDYEQMIKDKRLTKVENSKDVFWFEIEDDNPDDNLYYQGVEVNLEKKSNVISLSQYYN